MKKIIIFLILTSFSFGAFTMEPPLADIQDQAQTQPQSRTAKAKLLIKGLGYLVSTLGSEWYLNSFFTKQVLYQFVNEPAGVYIIRHFGISEFFISYTGFSLQSMLLEIFTQTSGTALAALLGIGVFFAITKFCKKITYTPGIKVVESHANNIINSYLKVNWNPEEAWNEIKKVDTLKNLDKTDETTEKLEREVGKLLLLQFIPILACALYKDDSLEIKSNVDLAKDILNHINNKIDESEGNKDLKDLWLASKYVMLYRNCHLNPASPTAAQSAILSSDPELIDLVFYKLPQEAKKQVLLLNKDKYGRTLMHHAAATTQNRHDLISAFDRYLDSIFLTSIGALSEKGQANINAKKIKLLKSYFSPSLMRRYTAWIPRGINFTGKDKPWFDIDKKYQQPLLIDNTFQSPLHKAAFSLNAEFISNFFDDKDLLKTAMVQQDECGRTPLHMAVMAATEMDENNTPQIRENAAQTITNLTKSLDSQTILKILAMQDKNGKTPIHYAAAAKNSGLINEIIKIINQAQNGIPRVIFNRVARTGATLADALKKQDLNGNTAMHAAAQEFAKYLKQYDITSIDEEIEKIKNEKLKFEIGTNKYKDQLKTITAYEQGILSNLEQTEKNKNLPRETQSKIKNVLLKIYSITTTTAKLALSNYSYNLSIYLKDNLKNPADYTAMTTTLEKMNIDSRTNGYGAIKGNELETIYQTLKLIRHEIGYLNRIISLQKRKIDLQKHLAESYFRMTEVECAKFIPATINALLNNNLVLQADKNDLLKIKNKDGQTAQLIMAENKYQYDQGIEQLFINLTPEQRLSQLLIADNYGNTTLSLGIASSSKLGGSMLQDMTNDDFINVLQKQDPNGIPTVHKLIKDGETITINKLLLQLKGKDDELFSVLTSKERQGNTVLHVAAEANKPETIVALIEKCPKQLRSQFTKIKNKAGMNFIHLAAKCNLDLKLMKDKKSLDANQIIFLFSDKDNLRQNPIHKAAQVSAAEFITQAPQIIQGLYKKEWVNILESEDAYGQSPLHTAILNNASMKTVKALINFFKNVTDNKIPVTEYIGSADYYGNTILHIAAQKKYKHHEDLLRLLFSNETLGNIKNQAGFANTLCAKRNKQGDSALHTAIKNKFDIFTQNIVSYICLDKLFVKLLELIKDKYENTILHTIAATDNLDTFEYVLGQIKDKTKIPTLLNLRNKRGFFVGKILKGKTVREVAGPKVRKYLDENFPITKPADTTMNAADAAPAVI